MKKDIILFDLDGTLTDPMVGITRSVQYALRAFGIEVSDLNELCCFIGPPLKSSFMKFYHFEGGDADKAVRLYREYFAERGMYENEVYEGIEEMLLALKDSGKTLMVATSKPTFFAKPILEHFRLDSYFTFVGGADLGETRVEKADVIQYTLSENKISDLSRVVMVGDREYDIIGAKTVGIASVGVLYGYGSSGELKAAGADVTVETVEQLKALLA